MKLWRHLPLDGLGGGCCADPELRRCRKWASARWFRRFSVWLRPVLYIASRLAWPLAALPQAVRFARLRKLDAKAFVTLYFDCVASGSGPVDAFAWRCLYRSSPPMSARSLALLLRELGSNDGRALLADKLALAARLKAAGLLVPRARSAKDWGCAEEFGRSVGPAGLFIKPRHGSGGLNANAITRCGDRWQMDGADIAPGALIGLLTQMTRGGEMILQDRLVSAHSLADLSSSKREPVLRIVTSRIRGGQPRLDSVVLIIPRPGFKPRNFLEGHIYAPVDPVTGIVKGGVLLGTSAKMLDCREPDGGLIAGRTIPFFDKAVRDALVAMAAVPDVPAIHWDIILTQEGPVFLEGNSDGNWILCSLAGRYGLEVRPLGTTLEKWLDAAPPARAQSALLLLKGRWRQANLSARAIGLILEAIAYLALARLVLLILPFRKVADVLGDLVAPDDPRVLAAVTATTPGSAGVAAEIGRTLEAVAKWVPFRAVCLQQALAGHAMLRRRRIPSVLHLGSGRDETRKFIAHAWLQAAGLPVTGYPPAPQIREVGCFIPVAATPHETIR